MKKTKLLVLTILLTILMIPLNAKATTLKEYEDQVAKYTAELKDKENQVAKSEQEIANISAKIKDIKNQISDCYNKTNALQEQIDQSNREIEEKKEQIKDIIKYYQLSNSGNDYLEYIMGADSITDMIFRYSTSEQLTSYNARTMKELNNLIEENTKKKEELKQKQSKLTELNAQLYFEQDKIKDDKNKVEGTMPSVKGQIAFYQKRVDYYKAKGCKSNDVIGLTCDVPVRVSSNGSVGVGALVGANGFRFPVNGGRVTQEYGNNGHKGVDIGKGCGAPIYAVATGRVYYVGNDLDNYGAGMVLIVHNVNGRLVFSQYAHLQGYNVSVGQDVTNNTIVGYMGNTGYSFGCHLHLEMSTTYGWDYNSIYKTYVKYIINPFNYIPRP